MNQPLSQAAACWIQKNGPIVLLITLLLISLLRIVTTYSVFNHTNDEPAHIAAAMQWLDAGTYRFDNQNPPMRAVYAVGPRLLGLHYYGEANMWDEGRRILYAEGHYWRNLTVARLAALPFYVLTVVLVFAWTRRLSGPLAGVLATLAYTTLPLALAHAGLATTDTLITATSTLALFLWAHWLMRPTLYRAALCSVALALAVLSKFTSILFLGVVLCVTSGMWLLRVKGIAQSGVPRRGVRRIKLLTSTFLFASVVMFLTLWAGYRFSFGPIYDPAKPADAAAIDNLVGTRGSAHDWVYRLLNVPVPAPEVFRGIGAATIHSIAGHRAFFMGEIKDHGHALFFPVAILIKTPIPFLVLAFGGALLLLGRGLLQDQPLALLPPLAAGLIVLVCMPSTINIGLRHVLPIFPLLAICAGVAAAALVKTAFHWKASQRISRAVSLALLALLLVWQVETGARAHPDYLAYFNECCADAPQNWLNDSDLDWGQDIARLSHTLRARGIQHLYIAYFGSVDINQHGLPPFTQLQPYEHVRGWVAASEFRLALGTLAPPYDQYRWLLNYQPVAQVGKSIRLYWIP